MQVVVRQTCITSPDLPTRQIPLGPARARPGIVTASAVVALVVVISGLALSRVAHAQEVHSGEVTIEARHPTALQGIDGLLFTVTRSVAADYDLEVPVTLSSGIIDPSFLSQTVTIAANQTSANLRVGTNLKVHRAMTGDVTATVGDGVLHDVGDPASASVRVHVGETLVTVRFSAGSYTLDEGIGTTSDEIILVAQTEPGVPAPTGSVGVRVATEGVTADPSDYDVVHPTYFFGSQPGVAWTEVGDVYRSEIGVPLAIHDDDLAEGDETFQLTANRVARTAATVAVVPADSTAAPCGAGGCSADVTIVDDDSRSVVVDQAGELAVEEGGTASYTVALGSEPTGEVIITPRVDSTTDALMSVSPALRFMPDVWDVPQTVTVTALIDFNAVDGSATITHTVTGADYGDNGVTAASVTVAEEDLTIRDDAEPAESVVVTLVHVPDGTVIPDNSTVAVGGTVVDGTTFGEDEQVLFRLLFSAAGGGPAPGGADVELSFEWIHHSPIVPTSGQISRIVLSLPRVDVWDSAVQILDNGVGNPDSTLTIRITGCERNGCVIGEPSEITVTIADDDGGPEAAPPGQPATPWLQCPDRGNSAQDTGLEAIWEAPDFVGGAPIDHYELRYRPQIVTDGEWQIGGEWQAWPHHSATTSTVISGLESDVLYGVQVRAVNANGPGQWSPAGFHRIGQLDEICDILDEFSPVSSGRDR